MARRSDDGRWILSASEIGAFTVCEESWRLREVLRVERSEKEERRSGGDAHVRWAKEFDEAQFLRWAIKAVVLLLLNAIAIYLLSQVR